MSGVGGRDAQRTVGVGVSGSALWRQIRRRGLTTLAVMGMSKNTGKTVALNHLLACAAHDGVAIGLTSIGRDGEEHDQVFEIPKPPVRVWPGSIVATARDTLARARVRCKLLAASGVGSPMGEIVLVLVLEHGTMEVAGASRAADQQSIIGQLRQSACALIVLDGALGRSQHASPAVAEGMILATGAAVGGGIGNILRKTRERLAMLEIAQADAQTARRCRPVFAQGGVGVWDRAGQLVAHLDVATLNAAAALRAFADRAPATIALSGAVGKRLWPTLRQLLADNPGLTLVVGDGTKLFIEHADLRHFRQHGGRVLAERRIAIVGITVNPCAPHGGDVVAADLLDAARRAFPEHQVSDVMREHELIASGVSL